LIEAVTEFALDYKYPAWRYSGVCSAPVSAWAGDGSAPGTVSTIPGLAAVFFHGPGLFGLIGIARKEMA
jgi:hypothetical protein